MCRYLNRILPSLSETEEEQLERKQNERDALDAVGDHECPPEMPAEVVPVVQDDENAIDCTQVRDWVVRGGDEECLETRKRVAVQFSVKYKQVQLLPANSTGGTGAS
jgi:hypothetical protein